MKIYDSHNHTNASPDSKMSPELLCTTAIDKGLCGIAITDHIEMTSSTDNIYASVEGAMRARDMFGDRLEIILGMELGEPYYDYDKAKGLIDLFDFDFILCSYHIADFVRTDGKKVFEYFSGIDFTHYSMEDLKIFYDSFVEKIKNEVKNADFDCFAHVNCAMRYIDGRYHIPFDDSAYDGDYEEIFDILIRREKALELNISGLSSAWGRTMPHDRHLKKYYEMGGRLVTVGSDSHIPDTVGENFERAAEILKNAGFSEYYYYKNRKPQGVKL